MRRVSILLVGTTALGLGLCAAYVAVRMHGEDGGGRASSDPAPASSSVAARGQGRDDLAALRGEIARLGAEVAALRQQVAKKPAAEEVEAPSDAKDERTDPVARAEAEAKRLAEMAALESSFRGEPEDPRWSSSTASALQKGLEATQIPQASVRSVECRSRTCRVEFLDDEAGDLASSLPLLAVQVGETLPTVTADHIDEGYGARTILYMSANP